MRAAIFIHRYISWVLVLVSLTTVTTGYIVSRGLYPDFVIFSYLHRVSEIIFLGLITCPSCQGYLGIENYATILG